MLAVLKLQAELSDIDQSKSFLDSLATYTESFLNLELTQISFDACPMKGLTTMGKHIFKLVFLLGIYLSWLGLFLLTATISQLIKRKEIISNFMHSLKIKLIKGMIEIIKYTYSGFCTIIFSSLVCKSVGRNNVWFYDGSHICFENWQIAMIMFGIFYAVPFPLVLFLATKQLKRNQISPTIFVLCCLCPLISVFSLCIYSHIKRYNDNDRHISKLLKSSNAIISVIQGPYRDDGKYMTLYWEAMISLRRLLITLVTLVGVQSIRMIITTLMCILFLYQHNITNPFLVKRSNSVEGLSLVLLSTSSVINLLKASLIDSGVVPTGPSVPFFKTLEFCEKLFVFIIIFYILSLEIKVKKCYKMILCCSRRRSGKYVLKQTSDLSKADITESTKL